MSGITNSSENEETIEIVSLDEPEEVIIPKSKITIYYEDPGDYTVFGLDRSYFPEGSNNPSTND